MREGMPAGWYPDPDGRADRVRWWDGDAWSDATAHVTAQLAADGTARWRSRSRRWTEGVLVNLVAVGILAGWAHVADLPWTVPGQTLGEAFVHFWWGEGPASHQALAPGVFLLFVAGIVTGLAEWRWRVRTGRVGGIIASLVFYPFVYGSLFMIFSAAYNGIQDRPLLTPVF